VHRDVTPKNVHVEPSGRAKLIDFGALTSFGMPHELVGTAPFMAPECLRDAPLDGRSDLFSLGALAYQLLAGQRAISATSAVNMVLPKRS
jgi:serine/threonine-protein kinase